MAKVRVTAESVAAEKVNNGLSAEEWEKAYIELSLKVKKREELAKEALRIIGKMF